MIFNIDSAMKHSYSNDDTCFSIDVIDEILEEDFNALLNEGSEILHSIEGTILKEKLFVEFDGFIAMTADENSKSKSETEELPFEKITFNTDHKIKHLLKNLLRILNSNLFLITWNMHSWKNPIFFRYAHLVLNLEKCHFMVKEGIMLGHKVSEAGLKVDKAKINVISKLPPLTNIKEVDIEIKDRKGTKNVVPDYLSRIKNDETSDDNKVDDNFPRETLMGIHTMDEPWFVDFANYMTLCLGTRNPNHLDQSHHRPTGGHYGPNTTAKKVLDLGSLEDISSLERIKFKCLLLLESKIEEKKGPRLKRLKSVKVYFSSDHLNTTQIPVDDMFLPNWESHTRDLNVNCSTDLKSIENLNMNSTP
nr:retrovirus-related Pol polyprotein [Tanacetum cinerariifolium]